MIFIERDFVHILALYGEENTHNRTTLKALKHRHTWTLPERQTHTKSDVQTPAMPVQYSRCFIECASERTRIVFSLTLFFQVENIEKKEKRRKKGGGEKKETKNCCKERRETFRIQQEKEKQPDFRSFKTLQNLCTFLY